MNFAKLQTLTMIALNLPYVTCPGFNFDQDVYSEELPFKFEGKKVKRHYQNDGCQRIIK